MQSPGHEQTPENLEENQDQTRARIYQMTATEYKAARQEIGLSNYALAPKLGVHMRTAQRYESGEIPVSETVARLLLMYVRYGVPKTW